MLWCNTGRNCVKSTPSMVGHLLVCSFICLKRLFTCFALGLQCACSLSQLNRISTSKQSSPSADPYPVWYRYLLKSLFFLFFSVWNFFFSEEVINLEMKAGNSQYLRAKWHQPTGDPRGEAHSYAAIVWENSHVLLQLKWIRYILYIFVFFCRYDKLFTKKWITSNHRLF